MLSSRQEVKLIGDPAVPGALRVPTTFSVPNGRVRLWVSVPSSMNPCKDVAAPVFPVSFVGSSWLLDTHHASWLVLEIALFVTTGDTELSRWTSTVTPTPQGVYAGPPQYVTRSSAEPACTPFTALVMVLPVTVIGPDALTETLDPCANCEFVIAVVRST